MIREFTLRGLTCANCAAKIEGSVNELDGVSYASVNLMTTMLRVEVSDAGSCDIHGKVERIVNLHEPDVEVYEKADSGKADAEPAGRKKIIWLIAGAVTLAAGLILEYLFNANIHITLPVFVLSYLLLGGKILIRAVKNIVNGKFFDEHFLMAVATIGAFAIGEYAEAAGVMLFYLAGELLQESAVNKSVRTIEKLMDIRPDHANLQVDGNIKKVAPDTINIGDIIIVKPGERIPLDGVVIEGESILDTSALTGETAPRAVCTGDAVLSGCVNQNGVLKIKATQTFRKSTVSVIIDLAQNAASKKAPAENFITRFAKYYTPIVVALALLIAVIPPLASGGAWIEWLNRGLIFLVISCPCALVISIPLGFFGGIGGASRKGILVKGGNYLEALSNLDIAVFDKTGTLTKGVFNVTDIQPSNGFTESELLEAAASAEAFSNHPIALSILREFGKPVNKNGLTGCTETAGFGVSVNSAGGTILAGNRKLMDKMGIIFEDTLSEGVPLRHAGTKVYVASDGVYMGCISISDEIKPDSRSAVSSLKELGVRKTVMLTGDNSQAAEAIANELEIDEVFSGLLPLEKVEIVEMLDKQKRAGGKIAFIGDGINDAPVLAMADVGVAMGGLGSDAAVETADIVLMTDEPSKLADAVHIARFTKRVVTQNIIFALSIKIAFLLLGALGAANMWEAVFADVGVALLAVLNAMRVMKNRSYAIR